MSKFNDISSQVKEATLNAMKTVYDQGWMDAKDVREEKDERKIEELRELLKEVTEGAKTIHARMEADNEELRAEVKAKATIIRDQSGWIAELQERNTKYYTMCPNCDSTNYDSFDSSSQVTCRDCSYSYWHTKDPMDAMGVGEEATTGVTLDEREEPVNGFVVLYSGLDGWARYSTLDELLDDQLEQGRKGICEGADKVFELGRQVRPVSSVKWEVKV